MTTPKNQDSHDFAKQAKKSRFFLFYRKLRGELESGGGYKVKVTGHRL